MWVLQSRGKQIPYRKDSEMVASAAGAFSAFSSKALKI